MLDGKVAVVTGGTRGIGFATVKKFLENEAKVILLGSRKESVDKAISELKSINENYEVEGAWPNLEELSSVKKTFEEINEKYGKIDILVNNAGMSAMDKIYDYKEEDFKKIINLNVNAVFNCSRAVVVIRCHKFVPIWIISLSYIVITFIGHPPLHFNRFTLN